MLHVVKRNDTLLGIAKQYGTIIELIMGSNVICNPNLIYIGQPLIIPEPNLSLPKAGGTPYYVINYGDTIWCLAKHFSQSIESLSETNQLPNVNEIYPGKELLVGIDVPNPEELYAQWNISENMCEYLNSLWLFGVFYKGSFLWEAIGERAVPYLKRLLKHPCNEVRFYTVMALGRIGRGNQTFLALRQALQDSDQLVIELAKLALKRYQLIPKWTKRIHITIFDNQLTHNLSTASSGKIIPKGTPVIVLRWNIPSPTGEVSGPGALETFDLVKILETDETGYMPRAGYGGIWLL
jgi:LysM repeat protein